MRYLCLIYHDEAIVDTLPAGEYDAMIRDALYYREVLREGRNDIASSPLQDAEAATTVRVRNGRMHITDGPFAETLAQLAGFSLIDARDLNEAIRLVSRMPLARFGSIEIRPVREAGRGQPARDGAGVTRP